MQSLSQIRVLLSERGLRPRHRFGQHFLHDLNQLKRLVEAAGPLGDRLVLEVGPGTGSLTEALLDAGADVVVVEIDRDLAAIVADRLGDRVTLVVGDCLDAGRRLSADVCAPRLARRDFLLVANLPYSIASPLMVELLMNHPRCRGQFVTIQDEVARRLTASEGTRAYGPLGIIVQALGTVRRIATVKPASFWPPPQVNSAMVAVEPRGDHGIAEPSAFARFVTDLFSRRRKQLGTVFGRDRTWPAGVTADMRAETLAVAQLLQLFQLQ